MDTARRGTVISLAVWESLPAPDRPALQEAARAAGARLREQIRRMDAAAIQEMQKRGLAVVTVDAATRRLWETEAAAAYGRLRGRYCPAEIFDDVRRLRDEHRARQATPGVTRRNSR